MYISPIKNELIDNVLCYLNTGYDKRCPLDSLDTKSGLRYGSSRKRYIIFHITEYGTQWTLRVDISGCKIKDCSGTQNGCQVYVNQREKKKNNFYETTFTQ